MLLLINLSPCCVCQEANRAEQVRVLAPTQNSAAALPMAIFRCDSVQTRFTAAVVRSRIRMLLIRNGVAVG